MKLKLVLPHDTAVPVILKNQATASQEADPAALFLSTKNQKQPKGRIR